MPGRRRKEKEEKGFCGFYLRAGWRCRGYWEYQGPGTFMCVRNAYARGNCCTACRKSNFHPTAMLNMSAIPTTFPLGRSETGRCFFASWINAKGAQTLWEIVEINYTSQTSSLIKLPSMNALAKAKYFEFNIVFFFIFDAKIASPANP